jgi:hypothetical protein
MTGQSKEDILARWMEFGVFWSGGQLEFRPSMLRRHELLPGPNRWCYYDLRGNQQAIELERDSLGFTVCGVPVVYELNGHQPFTTVAFADGSVEMMKEHRLSTAVSQSIFSRSGTIRQVTVSLTRDQILS